MILYIMQELAKVTELLEQTFTYQSQIQESKEFFVNLKVQTTSKEISYLYFKGNE
jgi:hypothetical protein